ncbi:MAG: sulfatase-like hydrolase/transferase [Flammeovirgaceae bacterium]|nr:sulfatase-like hydrolase/transferase [Flammeovirgaceae bacterium]
MNFLKSLDWRSNIYLGLLKQLLLAMFLFLLCRLGFYVFNLSYFEGITIQEFLRILWGGFKFDLAAILYINSLVIVLMILPHPWRFANAYQSTVKYIFFICNAAAIGTNVVDFIYYKFTLRRTTADIFQQFENETNKSSLFFQFILDYWYAVLFWTLMVWLMIWLYRFIRIKGPMINNAVVFYSSGLGMMVMVVGLFIGGVRGGFRHSTRPITLSNAGEYVSRPERVNLVLNTPFAIMRTWGKTKIRKVNYFSNEAELDSIYSPVHYPKDTGAFKKLNVVVIILESFSKEFFGVFNKDKEGGTYKGFTPFLDSLTQHSITYQYSFANGRKSIDGLPSVVSSIPSLGVPYVLTPFASNEISSLGSLLKEKGYHTSFFHGAPNGSMGFNSFMNLAGFEHYYGMSEYNNDDDFDDIWGIWDEKFLQFYASKLNEFQQPFASSFFSVSSHHPFKVPEEYEGKFRGGPQPINQCIEYTDYGLRKFFQMASKMPWYENTLFVITADHTSSNVQFKTGHTLWGVYSIPVIFFRPDHSLVGMKEEIVQQIDIMPTVLGYLNYDQPYVSFGRDAWKENSEPFAFNYRDNVYQLFMNRYLFVFDGKIPVALYNFKEDEMLTENLLAKEGAMVQKMERKIKAIIQQYNNRMVENRLVVR